MNTVAKKPNDDEVRHFLSSVDWNFPRAGTEEFSVHTVHPYPGNFIPQIPRYLVEILTKPGQRVVDPFCGSGTTGIEASRLGRHSFQSDICSASILVSLGKLALLTDRHISSNLQNVLRLLAWDHEFTVDLKASPEPIDKVALDGWFHPITYSQLKNLYRVVQDIGYPPTKQVLEMIFSAVLFGCSSTGGALTSTGKKRRHHWGWVADNVKPKTPIQHDALQLFRRSLQLAITISQRRSGLGELGQAHLIHCDARRLPYPTGFFDAVITSPPYIGMVDYTLAHRLDYAWRGWSIKREEQDEIGRRRARRRNHFQAAYGQDMADVSEELSRITKTGGYCALVVGASRSFPGADANVISAFERRFQLIWGPQMRTPTRRRVSARSGTEPSEIVAVFRKY